MAIVVEDGTGVANANSFVTLDETEEYHETRGNSSWLSNTDDDAKEAAIIRASDFINTLNFKGVRYTGDQALCFPRSNLYDAEGYLLAETAVPAKVKAAQQEAALKELLSPGCLTVDQKRGGRVKRKKIDVLETEYFEGAPSDTLSEYVVIRRLLKGLLKSNISMEITRS